MNISISKATTIDILEINELYFQLNKHFSDSNKVQSEYEFIEKNIDYNLIVAKNDEGKIIGSLLGIICHSLAEECARFLVIENLIVDKVFRGQGVGRMLMEYIEKIAKDEKCTYSILVSSSFRHDAHRFYEKQGYIDPVKGFRKLF